MQFVSRFLQNLQGKAKPWNSSMDIQQRHQQLQKIKLNKNLQQNIELIEKVSGSSSDLLIRTFKISGDIPSAMVCIDGLVNESTVDELLHNLIIESNKTKQDNPINNPADVLDNLVVVHEVKETDNLAEMFDFLANGETVILLDGFNKCFTCETKGKAFRSVTEPATEITLRGPRDSFIENLRTNTALVRHRIRIPHLWFEEVYAGKLTETKIEIAYIKGLANEDLIEEVRGRLKRIDTDSILETGYIQEFIDDQPLSPFPLLMETERPDKVAACLVEGRAAIFVQGTPFVLIVPTELPMMLQAPDDYYEKFPIATFLRIMRMSALVIALLLPALYVAVVTFHPELLPTILLMRITAAREGVPFPVLIEVLVLDMLFELLREAGLRLPMAIGQALSIVGALILGDAAIRAGIVAPSVVIIIALTAISSFVTPTLSLGVAIRMLRFIFTILGAIFGIFGIQFGLLILIVHVCSLRSFGVPYMSPVAPFILGDMGDNILRLARWKMPTRPKFVGQRERVRQDPTYSSRPDKSQRSREGED